MTSSLPPEGEALTQFLTYTKDELTRISERIALLSRRVPVIEETVAAVARGERVVHHFRGALAVDTSDPYDVAEGGRPLLRMRATVEPVGASFDVLRNGGFVATVPILFVAGRQSFQVTTVFEEADEFALDMNVPGVSGVGLVVNTEFVS